MIRYLVGTDFGPVLLESELVLDAVEIERETVRALGLSVKRVLLRSLRITQIDTKAT